MVQVLVTFDLTGKVTRAEALTGSGELRQAATDAVKQWTYRPVIRNGQPVYAMTTAMLNVAPPCVPRTPCVVPRPSMNAAETAAAFQRIRAIEQQWSRTAAVV